MRVVKVRGREDLQPVQVIGSASFPDDIVTIEIIQSCSQTV